tara:strand:+ start:290 stop:619 length:330 start_codon:yes stop_codon:yes gene_type:complete
MIDINKKYRTRMGDEVRIYALDGGDIYPVHGAYKDPLGWVSCSWMQAGSRMMLEGPLDLVEVKPRIQQTVWLALYPHGGVGFAPEVSMVKRDCLARYKVEIDCEEGEGL